MEQEGEMVVNPETEKPSLAKRFIRAFYSPGAFRLYFGALWVR